MSQSACLKDSITVNFKSASNYKNFVRIFALMIGNFENLENKAGMVLYSFHLSDGASIYTRILFKYLVLKSHPRFKVFSYFPEGF